MKYNFWICGSEWDSSGVNFRDKLFAFFELWIVRGLDAEVSRNREQIGTINKSIIFFIGCTSCWVLLEKKTHKKYIINMIKKERKKWNRNQKDGPVLLSLLVSRSQPALGCKFIFPYRQCPRDLSSKQFYKRNIIFERFHWNAFVQTNWNMTDMFIFSYQGCHRGSELNTQLSFSYRKTDDIWW